MIYPATWWGWVPPLVLVSFTEDPLGNLSGFLIPSLILGTASAAATMRMTRTMMLEVLRQDYIRTAWSKGLKEQAVAACACVARQRAVLAPPACPWGSCTTAEARAGTDTARAVTSAGLKARDNFAGFSHYRVFTSNGTWVPPSRPRRFVALLLGGGGGSGSPSNSSDGLGGSGGWGAIMATITSGNMTVTVGSGGSGVSGSSGYGGDRGDSQVSGTGFTTATATGGEAGVGHDDTDGDDGSFSAGNSERIRLQSSEATEDRAPAITMLGFTLMRTRDGLDEFLNEANTSRLGLGGRGSGQGGAVHIFY